MSNRVEITTTQGDRTTLWLAESPGLVRRHVKRIHVEWDDAPPSDISRQRLRDIFTSVLHASHPMPDGMMAEGLRNRGER